MQLLLRIQNSPGVLALRATCGLLTATRRPLIEEGGTCQSISATKAEPGRLEQLPKSKTKIGHSATEQ